MTPSRKARPWTHAASPPLPDDLDSAPQDPDVCWRAQWGTYAGGVYDSEFVVDRDFCGVARTFFDVKM